MTPGTNSSLAQPIAGGDVREFLISPKGKPARRSAQPVETLPLPTPKPTRYRCADIIRFPLGGAHELVYTKLRGGARILPTRLANILSNCRSFKTIDEHAMVITRQVALQNDKVESVISELLTLALPDSFARLLKRARGYAQRLDSESQPDRVQLESVRREFRELVEQGLLISEPDLLALAAPDAVPARNHPKISSIGVVTRNRIKSLKVCLISYIENSKRHGRENDFIVMDDSESSTLRGETRRMLRSLKTDWKVEIAYAGLEEKRSFANQLSEAGDLPSDVVDFALLGLDGCGCSTGANRNALLLHTVGDMFFSADDDTACRIAPVPESKSGVALDSRSSLMEFWFFPTREDAFQPASNVEQNILTIHEQLLGKNLGECMSSVEKAEDIKLEQCTPHLLSNLGSAHGKVAVTFNGTVGDSGMQVSSENLSLNNASHQRLLNFVRTDKSAGQSREVLRAVDRPTISDNIWCMSTALAFDNRELLPPFMPVQRNQDGLFGMTLRKCFEEKYFGHLPWAVLHDPPESRTYPSADFWKKTRTSDCIAACISSLDFCPGIYDGKQRLRALGNHLMKVGEMMLPDFEEFVRIQLWRLQSAYISSLESHLQLYQSSSANWATNFRNHLDDLRQGLTEKEYVIPQTLLQNRTVEEARELLRTLIFKFGQLLFWWPEIVETAGRLRASGRRLATPIH